MAEIKIWRKSRFSLKARQHALRHCEPKRKVVDMFSLKTFDKLFLEGEQRANLIKPAKNHYFSRDSENLSFSKLCMQSLELKK